MTLRVRLVLLSCWLGFGSRIHLVVFALKRGPVVLLVFEVLMLSFNTSFGCQPDSALIAGGWMPSGRFFDGSAGVFCEKRRNSLKKWQILFFIIKIQCDNILRQLFQMEPNTSSITLYRSKSRLAEALGISRKTIQRKVSRGELSQDSKGRVRIDELIALLKVDSMRVKRGPKIQLEISNYNNITYKYNGKCLEKVILELDEITILNETVIQGIVGNITNQLCNLGSATLEEIANNAMRICNHKRRLAKLGLSRDASKIPEILDL